MEEVLPPIPLIESMIELLPPHAQQQTIWDNLHLVFIGFFILISVLHFRFVILPSKQVSSVVIKQKSRTSKAKPAKRNKVAHLQKPKQKSSPSQSSHITREVELEQDQPDDASIDELIKKNSILCNSEYATPQKVKEESHIDKVIAAKEKILTTVIETEEIHMQVECAKPVVSKPVELVELLDESPIAPEPSVSFVEPFAPIPEEPAVAPVAPTQEQQPVAPIAKRNKQVGSEREEKKRRLKRLQKISQCLKLKRAAAETPTVLDFASFIVLSGSCNIPPGMPVEGEYFTDKQHLAEFTTPMSAYYPSSPTRDTRQLNAHANTWEPHFLQINSESLPSLFISNKLMPFAEPSLTSETFLAAPSEEKELCKYGNSCVRKGCSFLHSARPSQLRTCRYDSLCSRLDCHFAHSNGRQYTVQPAPPVEQQVAPILKIGFGKEEDNITQNLLLSQLGSWHMSFVPVLPTVLPVLASTANPTRHRVRML